MSQSMVIVLALAGIALCGVGFLIGYQLGSRDTEQEIRERDPWECP